MLSKHNEDAEDALTLLQGAWISDLDGALTMASEPDASGMLTGASYLSEGQHYIELKVTDSTGKQGPILWSWMSVLEHATSLQHHRTRDRYHVTVW